MRLPTKHCYHPDQNTKDSFYLAEWRMAWIANMFKFHLSDSTICKDFNTIFDLGPLTLSKSLYLPWENIIYIMSHDPSLNPDQTQPSVINSWEWWTQQGGSCDQAIQRLGLGDRELEDKQVNGLQFTWNKNDLIVIFSYNWLWLFYTV